jgi:hypothetical protein
MVVFRTAVWWRRVETKIILLYVFIVIVFSTEFGIKRVFFKTTYWGEGCRRESVSGLIEKVNK